MERQQYESETGQGTYKELKKGEYEGLKFCLRNQNVDILRDKIESVNDITIDQVVKIGYLIGLETGLKYLS